MKTYRATQKGYADERIVEEGEIFTTSAPKGSWMEEVEPKEAKPIRAPKPSE